MERGGDGRPRRVCDRRTAIQFRCGRDRKERRTGTKHRAVSVTSRGSATISPAIFRRTEPLGARLSPRSAKPSRQRRAVRTSALHSALHTSFVALRISCQRDAQDLPIALAPFRPMLGYPALVCYLRAASPPAGGAAF